MKNAAASLLMLSLATVLAGGVGCGGPAMILRRDDFTSANSSDLTVRWRKKIVQEPMLEYKPQEFASPALGGDRLYVGASNGFLYALSRRDGEMFYRTKLEGAVLGRPLVIGDRVFVGTQGGRMYSLDAKTGQIVWTYVCKGAIASTPVADGAFLYFTSGENRIYALERATGAWKWQFDRESPDGFTVRGQGSPLVLDGRVFVGFADGSIVALKSDSGTVVWTRSLAGDTSRFVDVDATPILWKGLVVVAGYSTGVHAIEPRDGSIKWRFDVEAAGTATALGDRVFVTSAKLGVIALDVEGRLVWRQAVSKGGDLSAPVVLGREVLFSAADDGVYVADQKTGVLHGFLFTARGTTGAPAVEGNEAYVLTNAGHVIGFGPAGALPGKKLSDISPMLID